MGVVRTGEDLPAACSHCHSPVRPEFNYCPSCGMRLRDVCRECRSDLEAGWYYCAVCGAPSAGDAQQVEVDVEREGVPDLVARAEAHNTRGSELYDNNEFDEAIREFTAAISLDAVNPVYHTNLAVALSELGDYDRALAEFKEAVRLEPSNAGAYLQMGVTYQEMERPREAVEAWKKVLELAPDSPEADEAREELENV